MTIPKYETPKCPICRRAGDVAYEEVDIGVGIQKFAIGWDCPEHGPICGACFGCGVPMVEGVEHYSWCRDAFPIGSD